MTEPKWLAVARAQLGVREAAGPTSNPKILGWAKAVGRALGIAYADDAVPWCGLFTGYCVTQAAYVPPPIAVRASAWAEWGESCEPMLGAILVFKRPGGGHVGFYVGEDATAYHVLGGNQSDAVSVARIAKDRCIAVRWPRGYPKSKPVLMAASGKLSANEA
jgi:uncharacterized protein (TIGR02594 family)